MDTITTPGRKFFDDQMAYIGANDADGLIDAHYTPDAVLITPADFLDTPPPHIVRGSQELKDYFRKYLAWQGEIKVESLSDFAETDDSIFFQAIITSKTGRWAVGDAWYMRDGKIARHYSFEYKLG